jgi:hypothetical protein
MQMQPSYGFIILRHVNSETTNKYWNQNVKLIRTFYPNVKIVIIDDNSNQALVKADTEYINVEVVQSEYKGRGELLPFVYFYKHKWFDNAVIIHDSVFIHQRVAFEKFNKKIQVLPLWHFNADNERDVEVMNSVKHLTNKTKLIETLSPSTINILGMGQIKWVGCFGVQCYINHAFLTKIVNKYNIIKLIKIIKNRQYRCGLERIMGAIFCIESQKALTMRSLFGDIFTYSNDSNYKWSKYSYDDYENMFKKGKIVKPFVKVWTGR